MSKEAKPTPKMEKMLPSFFAGVVAAAKKAVCHTD